jgi:hypothetical protein
MAHQEQIDFCKSVKDRFPQYFENVSVLDIGSLDINGNNHYLFTNYKYVGVDLGEGKNVNIVSRGHEYKTQDRYDVVISTECFEHDSFWVDTFKNMYEHLKSGKMFVFTCASDGRAEHGTNRTRPEDAPFVAELDDYYMNINPEMVLNALPISEMFSSYELKRQGVDLYFWGIKN